MCQHSFDSRRVICEVNTDERASTNQREPENDLQQMDTINDRGTARVDSGDGLLPGSTARYGKSRSLRQQTQTELLSGTSMVCCTCELVCRSGIPEIHGANEPISLAETLDLPRLEDDLSARVDSRSPTGRDPAITSHYSIWICEKYDSGAVCYFVTQPHPCIPCDNRTHVDNDGCRNPEPVDGRVDGDLRIHASGACSAADAIYPGDAVFSGTGHHEQLLVYVERDVYFGVSGPTLSGVVVNCDWSCDLCGLQEESGEVRWVRIDWAFSAYSNACGRSLDKYSPTFER